MPGVYLSGELARTLAGRGLGGQRVLLPRSAGGRPELAAELEALGASVDDVPTYRTVAPQGSADLAALHLAGGVDAATFTSSSTVEGLLGLVGGPGDLRGVTVACIGPVTAATAGERGLGVDIVASEHTIDGLVSALSAHFDPGA